MTDEESFLDATRPVDSNDRDDAVDAEIVSEFDDIDAVLRGDDVTDSVGVPGTGMLDFAEVKKERDEYLDTLLRLQADFENFRKRTMRHQTELLERASSSLVERLLPVLDALDLALAHAKGQGGEQAEGDLSAALGQIAGLLRSTLEKEGLERIDETEVAFDPTVHDAVGRVEEEGPGGHEPTVVEVMRSGYRLKGKIIRPAMVTVRG